ncbi:hypothetical protein HN011_010474 [Eciton burchellii]|nr:hypothetical protein HN011_010474 [Eciton burchellii]
MSEAHVDEYEHFNYDYDKHIFTAHGADEYRAQQTAVQQEQGVICIGCAHFYTFGGRHRHVGSHQARLTYRLGDDRKK